jgi:hypothetical protein
MSFSRSHGEIPLGRALRVRVEARTIHVDALARLNPTYLFGGRVQLPILCRSGDWLKAHCAHGSVQVFPEGRKESH